MLITYNINLTPVLDKYYETDASSLKTNKVILLEDYITNNTGFSFSVSGTEVKLVENLNLVNSEDVISALHLHISDEKVKKLMPYIKVAKKLKEKTFECITMFEDNSEVIFVQFNNEELNILPVNAFKDSSIITLDEDVDILFYFIVKNEFIIYANRKFDVNKNNILNLPTGFAKYVIYKTNTVSSIQTYNNDIILYSYQNGRIYSPFFWYADKVSLKTINVVTNEYILLNFNKEYTCLKDINYIEDIKNNIVNLYYLEDDNHFSYVATIISDSLNVKNLESNFNIDSILNADKEYQKRYFLQVYKCPLYMDTKHLYDILDNSFLEEFLKDENTYTNVVIKND